MRWNEVTGPRKAEEPKSLEGGVPSRAKEVIDKVEQLDEGRKYIDPNNHEQIAIDTPHHEGQQKHAHLPNGRAVNQDGSISHGGDPFVMNRDWADALRRQKFSIPKSRIIEGEGETVAVDLDPRLIEFLTKLQAYLCQPEE